MRYAVAGFAVFCLILMEALLAGAFGTGADTNVLFKVQIIDKDGVITAQPYVPPEVGLKPDPDSKGKPPVKGEILTCKQELTKKDFGDHSDTFVRLRCGDRTYTLSDVYFTN